MDYVRTHKIKTESIFDILSNNKIKSIAMCLSVNIEFLTQSSFNAIVNTNRRNLKHACENQNKKLKI